MDQEDGGRTRAGYLEPEEQVWTGEDAGRWHTAVLTWKLPTLSAQSSPTVSWSSFCDPDEPARRRRRGEDK